MEDTNLVPYTVVDLPPVLDDSSNAMIAINQKEFTSSVYFSQFHKKDDEFILNDASTVDTNQCANHPNVRSAGYDISTALDLTNLWLTAKKHPETVFPPLFGKTFNHKSGKMEYVLFDPKLKWEDNTVDSPIADGGGYLEFDTKGYYNCANAPRSFLNEEGCKYAFKGMGK